MDSKDVAAISIAKSFNKKWWDSKRPLTIKGTGTGAQLDAWRKLCPDRTDDLAGPEVDAAENACAKLRVNLKEAQGKCGKLQQDSAKGIKKMLELLGAYEDDLATRRKGLSNGAGVALAFADKICDVVEKQEAKVDKASSEAKDARSRVASLAKTVKPGMLEREKKDLLQKLVNERAVLTALEDEMTSITAAVKKVETASKSEIAAARTNKAAQPSIQRYTKARGEFDKKWNNVMHSVNEVIMDHDDLKAEIVGGVTADKAIASLDTQIDIITNAPGMDRYEALLDFMKKHAPKIIQGNKDSGALTKEQWSDLARIDEDFADEYGGLTDADNVLARAMRQIQKTAQPFKGVVIVDQKLKDAEAIQARRAKERANAIKVATPFKQQLDQLISQMP